jgi:YrbI family 3-deoxy-D-manno-octulosonate 8-phosphate phosphatase
MSSNLIKKMADLNLKFKEIKLLVLDFDGVMTDGYVYVDQSGREMVRCSRKDGLGIELLQKNNIKVVVISKEINPVVTARCQKLKIECWQAVNDSEGKWEILQRFCQKQGIAIAAVAYLGDDLNDLAVLQQVGLPITVADGHLKIKSLAQYITQARGGEHAVREVCELILQAKGVVLTF